MNGAMLTPTAFDYGALDAELARELHEAEEQIRASGHDQISAIVAIGEALARVKSKLKHGQWVSWLMAAFSMSISTAERYMRVADFAADKIVTVTNFSPSVLYLLSAKSTPQSLVQEVLDRVEADNPMPEAELKRRIKDSKRTVAIGSSSEAPQHQGDMQPAPEEASGRQTSDHEKEAANAAVLMLRESLADQFPDFLKLWEEAGVAFGPALRASAATPMAAVKSEPASAAADRHDGEERAATKQSATDAHCAEPAEQPIKLQQHVTFAEPSGLKPSPPKGPDDATRPRNDDSEELEALSPKLSAVEADAPTVHSHSPTMAQRMAMRGAGLFAAPPGSAAATLRVAAGTPVVTQPANSC